MIQGNMDFICIRQRTKMHALLLMCRITDCIEVANGFSFITGYYISKQKKINITSDKIHTEI